MSVIYVGISGKSGHGKDSVAQFIIDRFGKKIVVEDGEIREVGYNIKRFAFADALKEEVSGREKELCEKYNLPYEPDNNHRTLLQHYGMLRRDEDSNYWIKKLAKKIDADKSVKVALISDVRFLNECYWIKDRGKMKDNESFLVRVNRHGYLRPDINHDHPSETDLDTYVRNGNVPEGEEVFFNYEINCEDNNLEELKKDSIEVFSLIESELDVIGRFEEYLRQTAENNSKVDAAII